MNDITILHYTSNKIPEFFAKNVRDHLLKVTEEKIPIISISQKPMDFGYNICVGDIGASVYNVYRQIYEGLKITKTKYICCCEDDSLYVMEHFDSKVPDDAISYNMSRWQVSHRGFFFYLRRTSMLCCIAPTEVLFKTLNERFTKYPEMPPFDTLSGRQRQAFGEPGRYENRIGLPTVKINRFETVLPVVTFRHREGLGGFRGMSPSDIIKNEIEYWGNARDLWKEFYG